MSNPHPQPYVSQPTTYSVEVNGVKHGPLVELDAYTALRTVCMAVLGQRDELVLERDALERCISAVQTEKDGIAAERDRAIRQRDHARAVASEIWERGPYRTGGDPDDGWQP